MVYPRMYGETAKQRQPVYPGDGLSPHVRGNRRAGRAAPYRSRSIPRMYGETNDGHPAVGDHKGLSPHVRGNRVSWRTRNRYRGSIPACTGKPHERRARHRQAEVYPRMYGETLGGNFIGTDDAGLSPHVRGNREPIIPRTYLHRSIPACTGKPGFATSQEGGERVYPRMYGETELPA